MANQDSKYKCIVIRGHLVFKDALECLLKAFTCIIEIIVSFQECHPQATAWQLMNKCYICI